MVNKKPPGLSLGLQFMGLKLERHLASNKCPATRGDISPGTPWGYRRVNTAYNTRSLLYILMPLLSERGERLTVKALT